ncbi:MAG: TrkH family potassium uptake protein [Clostridia bacterium]|nr:TrkH family potassium uptake protein [Clostridia bacterium]
MKLKSILYVIGIVLIFVGLSMLLPLGFAIFFGENGEVMNFLIAMLITITTGLIIFKFTEFNRNLSNKEGILIGALGWLIIPFFGSIPYILSGTLPNWYDAYFEAVSGFTTTGATVMLNIEGAPKSVLLWRSFTQWLGAMGILLVFVALIAKMGIGGTRLLKAETPGPTVSKILPRVSQYAKAIWIVYIALTIVQIMILMLVGLDFYEALNHTFTSIATGGFSTRNDGLAAFDNHLVDFVVIFFMIIGGGNFALYYVVFTKRDPLLLFKDEEYRSYLLVLLVGLLIAITSLSLDYYGNISDAIRFGSFQIVSLLTGAGHVTYDYDKWTSMVKMLLFTLMFFGGCQYSTTGGIKMVRMLMALKFINGEIRKLVHPRLIYQIRINNTPVQDSVVSNVIGFFLLYFIFFFVTAIILSGFGFDKVSSVTASAAILGNVGPAMGIFGPTQTYAELPNIIKLWLSLTMIMGRLEIYPMLILFQVFISKKDRMSLLKGS